MTSGLFGVGRLALWEQSAVGLRATGAGTLGAWDADGSWRPSPAGYQDDELRVDVTALLRLWQRGQIYALAPVVTNRRGHGDDLGTAGGLGDLELGVRYELLETGEHPWLPALGVTASALLPTAVRPEEAQAPWGVDATGRGAPGVGAAVSAEQLFGRLFARLDGGAVLYAPFVRSDLRQAQRFGPSVAAAASIGGLAVDALVLGATVGVVHDRPLTLGQDEVPASAATLASAGLFASYTLWGHWTLVASTSSGLFLDGLGQNRPGRVTASLGVRYGAF
ncbi:MAG: hypothetical protein HYS27_26955 [Deltaproteobacteria bacterium]|nr:hypothetical protein [Deltaproteobacteria bacterium]